MTTPSLTEFLDKISAGRDGVPISIDEAQQVSGLNRGAVLDRFRRLQSQGEGYLRLGRHGHPTRFYFRSSSGAAPGSAVQDAARGSEASESVERLPTSIATDSAGREQGAGQTTELVDHHFRLRADLRIAISLPADLNEREANRIARFIEALPL